jgi:hypothetical protein
MMYFAAQITTAIPTVAELANLGSKEFAHSHIRLGLDDALESVKHSVVPYTTHPNFLNPKLTPTPNRNEPQLKARKAACRLLLLSSRTGHAGRATHLLKPQEPETAIAMEYLPGSPGCVLAHNALPRNILLKCQKLEALDPSRRSIGVRIK